MPANRLQLAGSNANYWQLTQPMVANAQVALHPLDRSLGLPTEPHWYMTGTVIEVIHEADSDHHIWLRPEGTTKDRFALEISPQQPLTPPKVGDHIRAYGILRYDHQHGWWELHPLDHWEVVP